MIAMTRQIRGKGFLEVCATPNLLVERGFIGNLFQSWLLPFFNRVDLDRIDEVGGDIATAEWLLKNGAAVKWASSRKYLTDFSHLPKTMNKELKVQEVDATDSVINEIGFPHFTRCDHFDKLVLKNCK